jgi:hypothetical protein
MARFIARQPSKRSILSDRNGRNDARFNLHPLLYNSIFALFNSHLNYPFRHEQQIDNIIPKRSKLYKERSQNMNPQISLTLTQLLAPLVIAVLFIAACSLLKEPARRNFSAIMIAGAGAAYLSGGLGVWEFAFCALMTFVAYRGLSDYRFIGLGWLLHTAWDVMHHLYGNPIVPFVPDSSAGCAISDSALALWYFLGAPSVYSWFESPPYEEPGTK